MSETSPNVSDMDEFIEGQGSSVYRAGESLIYRADEGEHGIVEGRVVPYDAWTEVDNIMEGHFMESFARGSMKKTLMERGKDVRVYFEHRRSNQFGPMPVAELVDTWEDDSGVFMRAKILSGLPEFFVDGLRKGLYALSVGAEPVKTLYRSRPPKSSWNPAGIAERVRQEVRAFDYSITSRPVYAAGTELAFRSITDEIALQPYIDEAKKDPTRVLQIFRALLAEEKPPEEPVEPPAETPAEEPVEPEAEPPHSEPDPPAEPVEVEASRDTQTPAHDYLSEEREEEWRL